MFITIQVKYPLADNFFEKLETDIPELSSFFLKEIILRNKEKKSIPKYTLKVNAIAHSIISATRPRSSLSCLQVGVGVFLLHKYGSKKLLENLSSLVFCASYEEIRKFENSIVNTPQAIQYVNDHYMQLVFDNADHNVTTLDGKNTLHVMAGVCVTPGSAVKTDKKIPLLKDKVSVLSIGESGKINVDLSFKISVKSGSGLKNFFIKNSDDMHYVPNSIKVSTHDIVWIFGKYKNDQIFTGWNRFMQSLFTDKEFEKTRIIYLPFINSPRSNEYKIIIIF